MHGPLGDSLEYQPIEATAVNSLDDLFPTHHARRYVRSLLMILIDTNAPLSSMATKLCVCVVLRTTQTNGPRGGTCCCTAVRHLACLTLFVWLYSSTSY